MALSSFGRNVFNDPFFDSDPFEDMDRRMNSMMQSMGMGMGMGMMGMPRLGQGFDDVFGQGLRNAPNSSVYSTVVSQSYSSDGRGAPHVVRSVTTQRSNASGVTEVQHRAEDSRKGSEHVVRRQIGSRAKEVRRQKDVDGKEQQTETLHNLHFDDADDFDREWDTQIRALPGGRNGFIGNAQLPASRRTHRAALPDSAADSSPRAVRAPRRERERERHSRVETAGGTVIELDSDDEHEDIGSTPVERTHAETRPHRQRSRPHSRRDRVSRPTGSARQSGSRQSLHNSRTAADGRGGAGATRSRGSSLRKAQ